MSGGSDRNQLEQKDDERLFRGLHRWRRKRGEGDQEEVHLRQLLGEKWLNDVLDGWSLFVALDDL